MNTVFVVAASWLVLGVFLVFTGLPQSFSGGWRSALYLVLFGPPIYVLAEFVLGGIGEVFFKIFVPKSIGSWHPVLRIVFFAIYAATILLLIVVAVHYFFTET